MANSFLYQIAKAYARQSDVELRRCLFVFPSRRSSLFFQKYLGQCSDAPVFSPDMVTIGDLFARLSPYRKGDKIELLYILWQQYEAICRNAGREAGTFDDFVSFGETLLADFGDVDKYLADHSKLFTLVSDLRQLDSGYEFLSDEQREALVKFWGVMVAGQDSEQKKQFLSTWEMLEDLYCAFKEALCERGIAYEGMVEREVAERILHCETDGIAAQLAAYNRIVVIGQNALSKCELALLKYIKSDFDGDFYWDYYGECLTDGANKASHFIKGYVKDYPSKYKISAGADGRPEVKVVAVSSAVAQAKVAQDELRTAGEDTTAVVLPDEGMLMPLLNSIPENIRNINVTMGYGLHNSSVASLLEAMASLQINKREKGFYHKDVTAILNHPAIREACPESSVNIRQGIIAANKIYVGPDAFSQDALQGQIFRPMESPQQIASWQLECLAAIAPHLTDIEREFAHGYYTAISHLRDLDIPMEKKTYFRFLREVTASLTVSFRGEPLSGLQVMGPLEVRALDFDTLIILSVNEGVFPAKVQSDSMIPYNVRRGFGLPTVELFDSIAAYHFYRSIYRAKKVVLVYDSRTKGMMSGEESRFIKQLQYHYQYPIVFESLDLEIKPVGNEVRSVAKSDDIIARMRELFIGEGKKDFSASALNDYLACKLKFYYKHVKGLQEEEEVSEEVDAGQFGNTYHHTMQAIYESIGTNAVVTAPLLKKYIKEDEYIDSLVRRFLNKELNQPEESPLSRRNQITANLVAEMVRTTLSKDAEYADFTFVEAEKRLRHELEITVGGAPEKVYLKGFIDRQDRKDGEPLRICDYKTGSVDEVSSYLDAECLDAVFAGEKKTSFQMLVYALLKTLDGTAPENYLLAVYPVKTIYSKRVENRFCPGETVEAFAARLRTLLEEIFDASVPFDGVEAGNKTCEYCPARAICGR